jgi:hypothetical protein
MICISAKGDGIYKLHQKGYWFLIWLPKSRPDISPWFSGKIEN